MLGVPCRAVMPDTAPATKMEGFKRWGGVPTFLPRRRLLDWLANEGWKTETEAFIRSFADPEVMAGHGGFGLELVEEIPDLARVVIPVGGGGLIGGTASAIKGLRPEVEVVGVQSDGYAMWTRVLELGAASSNPPENTTARHTPPLSTPP